MKTGLLWHDSNDDKSMSQKITEAMEQYKRKFGTLPNTVFINPYDNKDVTFNGVEVQVKDSVQRNHVWVGVID